MSEFEPFLQSVEQASLEDTERVFTTGYGLPESQFGRGLLTTEEIGQYGERLEQGWRDLGIEGGESIGIDDDLLTLEGDDGFGTPERPPRDDGFGTPELPPKQEEELINHIEDLDLDAEDVNTGLRERVNKDRATGKKDLQIAQERQQELTDEAKRLIEEHEEMKQFREKQKRIIRGEEKETETIKQKLERQQKVVKRNRELVTGEEPLAETEAERKQKLEELETRRKKFKDYRAKRRQEFLDRQKLQREYEPESGAERYNRLREEEEKEISERLRKATQRGLRRQTADTSLPPTTEVGRQIEEAKQIVRKNIDAIIERGEALEDLRVRGQRLKEGSKQFLKEAKILRRIKERSPLGAMLKKLLAVVFGLTTGSVAYNTFMAIFFDKKKKEDDTEEKTFEKEINNFGTNSGKMNPEVIRNKFGTEALFETSQGDLYYDPNDDIMIISYRGTDFSRFADRPDLALIDIINDLNMGTQSYMGLLVHAGFLKMFLESLPKVTEFINDNITDETIVYTCGHSAGSPSAVLLAYTLNLHRENHNAVAYTFGSPRFVIEGKSAQMINEAVPHNFRINSENDLIPYLPPRIKPNPLPQYIHVGTEYIFNSEKLGGYGILKEDTRTTRSLSSLGLILAGILAKMYVPQHLVFPDGTSLASRINQIAGAYKLTYGILNELVVGFTRINEYLNPNSQIENLEGIMFNKAAELKSRFLFDFPQAKNLLNDVPVTKEELNRMWDYDDGLDDPLKLNYAAGGRFDEYFGDGAGLMGIIRLKHLGIPIDRYKKYLNALGGITHISVGDAVVVGSRYRDTIQAVFGRSANLVLSLFPSWTNLVEVFIQGSGLFTMVGIVRGLYGLATGQINRFMGHRTSNYDKILSAFTEGKASLGHSIKSEKEILNGTDIKTDDGMYRFTEKEHLGRPVYESAGMNFTPHYHDGEIYMNHIPNLQKAIVGYYYYKPNEFKYDGPIKGFCVF